MAISAIKLDIYNHLSTECTAAKKQWHIKLSVIDKSCCTSAETAIVIKQLFTRFPLKVINSECSDEDYLLTNLTPLLTLSKIKFRRVSADLEYGLDFVDLRLLRGHGKMIQVMIGLIGRKNNPMV